MRSVAPITKILPQFLWKLLHKFCCHVCFICTCPGELVQLPGEAELRVPAGQPPELHAGGPAVTSPHLHSTVQYSTVHYSTVQYSTVQYSTVQLRPQPLWALCPEQWGLCQLLICFVFPLDPGLFSCLIIFYIENQIRYHVLVIMHHTSECNEMPSNPQLHAGSLLGVIVY